MQVPEASVDEDDALPRTEDEVGLTRERLVVEAIAVSQGVNEAADLKLRGGVLAADAAHVFRAAGGI